MPKIHMTSFLKKYVLGVALMASLISAAKAEGEGAGHGMPDKWNDTSIGIRLANDFYFPGSAAKVAQKIAFLNTVGGFKYGSYMFNVDFLASDKNNPEANGPGGAAEVYSVGHITWSAGKITGKPMSFGYVKDLGVTTGYELSAKNDAFGSRSRMAAIGLTAEFAVSQGFWKATVGMRTENNHNGIAKVDVQYDPALHFESSWDIPFNMGPASVKLKGFASITAPKGKDGFHVETVTETLVRTSLLFDVGALWGSPRTLYAGPGYEYWKNMFGTPASEKAGTKRSAPFLVAEVHF